MEMPRSPASDTGSDRYTGGVMTSLPDGFKEAMLFDAHYLVLDVSNCVDVRQNGGGALGYEVTNHRWL